MPLSRNARRMVNKQRAEAKTLRIKARIIGIYVDNQAEIVRRNMSRPPERNFYPPSCLNNLAGQSHRVYICRASGSGKVR